MSKRSMVDPTVRNVARASAPAVRNVSLNAGAEPRATFCARWAICLVALLNGCACEITETPPPPTPVAEIEAVPSEGGFDLVLSSLERPVRSLQVDVQLAGAQATAARQLSGADIIEAALANPKDDFTVVVSDTRRLNLPPGGVVHVDTDDAPSSITLTNAFAVDDLGAKRVVAVVTP